MTGYGQGAAEAPGVRVKVELRSVNNRFVDLKLRLPDELVPLEQELRRKVLATVKRGRVDVDLRLERTGVADVPLALDRSVVAAALESWKVLRDEFDVQGPWDLHAMLRVPGLYVTKGATVALDEAGQAAAAAAMDQALVALDAERAREGRVLRDDLAARVTRMTATVTAIRDAASEIPAAMQKKLVERVGQLVAPIALDPGRVAQEAAFLADRADITEEIVRLLGHLDHARTLLADDAGEPVGKRLEFLLQEIHRETNTIASKSADLSISRHALDLKTDAEKLREQIQNLE